MPTRDRPRQPSKCLRALSELDYPRDQYAVLSVVPLLLVWQLANAHGYLAGRNAAVKRIVGAVDKGIELP